MNAFSAFLRLGAMLLGVQVNSLLLVRYRVCLLCLILILSQPRLQTELHTPVLVVATRNQELQ